MPQQFIAVSAVLLHAAAYAGSVPTNFTQFEFAIGDSSGTDESIVSPDCPIWQNGIEWGVRLDKITVHATGPAGSATFNAVSDLGWLPESDLGHSFGNLNDSFELPLPLPSLYDRSFNLGAGAAQFSLALDYLAEIPEYGDYPAQLSLDAVSFASFEHLGASYTATGVAVEGRVTMYTVFPSPGFAACAMLAAPMALVRRRRDHCELR